MAAYGSPEYELTWKDWDMQSGPQICALRGSPRRSSDSGFTGWPTPLACDADGGPRVNDGKRGARLREVLFGWATPAAHEAGGTPEQFLARKVKARANGASLGVSVTSLSMQAQLHGWATPTTRDHKDGASIGTVPVNGLLGRQVWAYAETTAGRVVLNPAFHLWLQGYPAAWHSSGEAAMRSFPSSRRSSSSPAKKP